jgi:hypothetical protein
MNKLVLTLALALALALGTVAQAVVLTFDGAICNGASCTVSDPIDQSYGDIPGQLDVIYTSRVAGGNTTTHLSFLRWWGVGYSDLVNVAWGGSNDIAGVAEIALIPAPGFQVRLNGFDLGSFNSASRGSQYTIYDSAYNPLISSGAITVNGNVHSHFAFNLTSAQGLIIQWGPSAFNVGIDNVDFTVTPTGTSTGDLQLDHTRIKTVTADAIAPALVTLPTCPTRADLFSPTTLTCPANATACTAEANITSEVSNVTPGSDSIRYFLTVDGVAAGIFPNTNFGAHSTAKAGRVESATASWIRRGLAPGNHIVEAKGCVANTTPDGLASARAGDRILTLRLFRGN